MKQEKNHLLETLSKEQILGTIPSGLFLVDDKRHVVYWNSEAERITGYSPEEIVGQHCSILEGIECGSGCKLFDDGTPQKPDIGSECHIRTKTGHTITISKNIDLLRLKGKVVGGIETFIDITPQKKLEDKLRLHSERLEEVVKSRTDALHDESTCLRSILDGMADMAYIVTADLRIDFFNKAMERVFGAKHGERCYEVIHNRSSPCIVCPWGKITSGAIIEERQFEQNDHTYEVIHSPVYGPRGELQQLSSFAHTVSHDLRSPLTGVGCYTELIKEEYGEALKGEGIKMLEEVETQANRMLNIITDMLCFSTADHIEPTKTPSNTNTILSQVLTDNQFEINKKAVFIATKNLPKLKIPETLLYELISNLLLNAIRYGCKQGGRIEIQGGKENRESWIEIRDHGPGIPEKERESVFDVFVRGSTSGHTQGTGIGLATVHKIVQRFKGEIQLLETQGGGCTVKLQFPEM